MTILSLFDIGLVVLILGIGASAIAARTAFAAVAFVRNASDQENEVPKATSGR